MQVPILSGIYTDAVADYRTAYPRNLVPVPKPQGVSEGYLRPAPGIVTAGTGQGNGRGGVNWNGTLYRVSGSKFCRVAADGTVTVLGDVGNDGLQCAFDYSFDRLAIASARKLFYWNGAGLTQVTDTDLGDVLDVLWIAGYFMTTDGTDVVVTDLTDPTSVTPLHYGSSEADPDAIMAVRKLRNEAYVVNRYTIEVFQNVGGDTFPFSPIEGAMTMRGAIGTHMVTYFQETLAFVGGGRQKEGPEPPAVWLMSPGGLAKLSTREIDTVLQQFTEAQLAECVVETKVDRNHELLMIHLPDRCVVYDAAASAATNERVWFTLDSSLMGFSTYRARGLVWCYDRWNVDDPTSSALGTLSDSVSSHYGQTIGWDFGTIIFYNGSNGAVFHELELVALTGRAAFGANPTIWTSYSLDGVTWSQERPRRAGSQGDRKHRLCWRNQGRMQTTRMQRFRGTSDVQASFARLEVDVEALSV